MNVANQANAFLKEIRKSGFGGLKVLRIEKESIWHEQYAIFMLEFNIPIIDAPHCEYCTSEFQYEEFYDDLLEKIKTEFSGCEVTFNKYTHEYEILGPFHKEYYFAHQEALEEMFSDDYEEGTVFVP